MFFTAIYDKFLPYILSSQTRPFRGGVTTAKKRVGFIRCFDGHRLRETGEKFPEGKGEHLHFHVASSEQCGEVVGEEMCIRAGDVEIDIVFGEETIDNFFKLRHVLYFV